MASSDNLVAMEPWAFRPTFADSWLNDAFARDTETLTRALQKSLSSHSDNVSSEMMNPFYQSETTPAHTPTVSGGSENETAVSKRRSAGNGVGGVNGGKITKRKSRASKRSTTTFITADPANFRQMVQQVTGVRFGGNCQLPVNPVLKPEPQRPPVNRLQAGCLPTLDTSAFLLDPPNSQQQQQQVGPASALVVPPQVAVSIAQPSPLAVVADGGSSGFDFESFCSFPTLESWN
ncbi:calmodulin-binding protein 25-like [Coffea arabica]|uniref:Calmodulin-binding protein 25-like n=1 Tax=Coffea arabica TaxID=13443 RepID=A0A6P6SSU8_COFAR|nr:calmodulin-binding protein 25-like [Coffea arabica]